MTITEKLEAVRAAMGEADRNAIELRRRYPDVEVWSMADERLYAPTDSFGLPVRAPRPMRDLQFTQQEYQAADSLKDLIENHPDMKADPWPRWALLGLQSPDPGALPVVVVARIAQVTEAETKD